MTDDESPTPIPAATATGSANAGTALQPGDRRHDDRGDEHRGREAVEAAQTTAACEPVREDDVEGEEGGIGEGERESDGLTCEPDIGEQIHTEDRERESDGIPRRTSPYGGQGDDREELDRRDRPERQPFDRKVEARVHGGEDDCEVDDGLSVGALCGRRTRATVVARGRRPPRRSRSEARRHRVARPGRRAGRRTQDRGSGRPRSPRRTPAVAPWSRGARPASRTSLLAPTDSMPASSLPACHSGMDNRRT